MAYNTENNITPQQIKKTKKDIIKQSSVIDAGQKVYVEDEMNNIATDPIVQHMSAEQLTKTINKTKRTMKKAAKNLDFLEAAMLRDELYKLEELLRNS